MTNNTSLEALRGLLVSSKIEVINYTTKRTMLNEIKDYLNE
jgi:hypothetical protein